MSGEDGRCLRGMVLRSHLRVILQHAKMRDTPVKENVEVGIAEETKQVWFWLKKTHRSKARLVEDEIDPALFGKWIDLTAFMNPAPISVLTSCPLVRAYILFRSLGLRHMPVVDFQNNVCGMITRNDLISKCDAETKEEMRRSKKLKPLFNAASIN